MSSGSSFDLPAKRTRLEELRKDASAPDLWNDQARAQDVTRKLARLDQEIQHYEGLVQQVEDLEAANELALEDADAELTAELQDGIVGLRSKVDDLEIQTLFTDELDDHDAIVSIHAGEGGTDAMDWAEMLLRMYLRWAEQKGFQAEVREALAGEEAGVKSATIEVRGDHAYGLLRSEHGVHRLVRKSPFDAAHRRHTPHASVDVIPDFGEEELEIEIDPDDLRTETFRAGGPGGQYVNTTDSAVRLTHIPTNITASCQSERSQLSNKIVAMKLLKSRLLEVQRQEREKELSQLRGERKQIGFGSRIRSYVMDPYQMVKDHRTALEKSNVEGVLDGDIEQFMQAFLHWKRTAT